MNWNSKIDSRGSSEAVLTDFLINETTNVDTMYDKISFHSKTNDFRPISFKHGSELTKFNCSVELQTPEGYKVALYLRPSRYFSIKVTIK